MKLQLIRNATLKMSYGDKVILIDPMFSKKHAFRSFAGIEENPTVDLKIDIETIMNGVDGVIVSHLHPDHYDEAAQAALDKQLPLFCQPVDFSTIESHGFKALTPVEDQTLFGSVTMTRTAGQHGFGAVAERLGPVSGFVFEAPDEPKVYWAGDTVWYEEIEKILAQHQPDIIITHSGGAAFPQGGGPILMDVEQTLAVCQAAPQAIVIATHMESLDHCAVTRQILRDAAEELDVSAARLLIPADGEEIVLG